ncbi:MAG TPA: glycosyl hydrolase family 28-related protein [Terriglobales bacterium]|nr:glycosyl hydrolase family 28-related protein [Terriglobales bacterium]
MSSGKGSARQSKHITFVLSFLVLIAPTSLSVAPIDISPVTVKVTSPLKFTVTQGGAAVRSHAVVLRNDGTKTLDWAASSNQGWLRFEPASGSISPRGTASVELVADPTGFAPGIYVASAEIVPRNEAPQTFPVTMLEESAFTRDPIGNAQRTFAPDSGMVNVKTQYGAKGDGVSDDTNAIQQAISSVVHHPSLGARIIYFPAGTYLISRPLLEKDLNGQWNSLLTLQGENRATTMIRLKDNDPLYQSAGAPAAVLKLASQHGGPQGGGNSAFDNNIFDMTIDVGHGNPGAIALAFLGNNYCAVRNVTLESSDPRHSGAIGLGLLRYAAGPCLVKNVVINGFDYGIKVANNEYSLTFEDLTLLNQRRYGIYNANNVLSIRHLLSTNSVPAIHNENAAGLITLLDANLRGGSSQSWAIQNQGTLYARNITSSGYASVVQNKREVVAGTSISEYDSGPTVGQSGGKELSLNLVVEETPHFEDTNLSHWKNVVTYGADPTGKKDSSAAIQSAIDSGATTVYFPTGVYIAAQTIHLRDKVRILEGFGSSLNPSGNVFQDPSHPVPLLKIDAGPSEVVLNHMRIAAYYPHPCPGVIAIQQDSARPFVLRDSLIGGLPTTIAYQNTSRGSGTLFVENVAGTPWQILFPQNVFARQINPEGNAIKITNEGGHLWILGLKTEGPGTNIKTEQGGSTELLGGLIYPVWKIPAATPGFVVNDSRASFIYAVSNYKPAIAGANFAVQIEETQHGVTKALLSTSLPSRGLGTMTPLYRAADLAPHSSPDSKPR